MSAQSDATFRDLTLSRTVVIRNFLRVQEHIGEAQPKPLPCDSKLFPYVIHEAPIFTRLGDTSTEMLNYLICDLTVDRLQHHYVGT